MADVFVFVWLLLLLLFVGLFGEGIRNYHEILTLAHGLLLNGKWVFELKIF